MFFQFQLGIAYKSVAYKKACKALVNLQRGIQVQNNIIHICSNVLSMRLIVLVKRSDDSTKYFGHELTPYPHITA